jgi:hypothetical protein
MCSSLKAPVQDMGRCTANEVLEDSRLLLAHGHLLQHLDLDSLLPSRPQGHLKAKMKLDQYISSVNDDKSSLLSY